MNILDLEGISKTIESDDSKSVSILAPQSLALKKHQICVIHGPSGSGKTTMLAIAGLIETPSTGVVRLSGEVITNIKSRETIKLRQNMISIVPQNSGLIMQKTVLQNVELPLMYQGISKRERMQIVTPILQMLNIEAIEKRRANRISGGEKIRCSVARAIVRKTPIIILDEPTAALDRPNSENLATIFLSLAEKGHSLLIASHDPVFNEKHGFMVHHV